MSCCLGNGRIPLFGPRPDRTIAPATISRLLNMGVEPFLITASVNLVLAQRLARKICTDCKQPLEADREALKEIGFEDAQLDSPIYKGVGCSTCSGCVGCIGCVGLTGAVGKVGVHKK